MSGCYTGLGSPRSQQYPRRAFLSIQYPAPFDSFVSFEPVPNAPRRLPLAWCGLPNRPTIPACSNQGAALPGCRKTDHVDSLHRIARRVYRVKLILRIPRCLPGPSHPKPVDLLYFCELPAPHHRPIFHIYSAEPAAICFVPPSNASPRNRDWLCLQSQKAPPPNARVDPMRPWHARSRPLHELRLSATGVTPSESPKSTRNTVCAAMSACSHWNASSGLFIVNRALEPPPEKLPIPCLMVCWHHKTGPDPVRLCPPHHHKFHATWGKEVASLFMFLPTRTPRLIPAPKPKGVQLFAMQLIRPGRDPLNKRIAPGREQVNHQVPAMRLEETKDELLRPPGPATA